MPLLSIDTGLSVVKAGLFTCRGESISIAERPNTAVCFAENTCQIDMMQLWALCCEVIREVMEASPSGTQPDAIGVSGHGNGAYFIDSSGKPVLAIGSMDTRAQSQIAHWKTEGIADEITTIVGGHVWAGQPIALLAHLGTNSFRGCKLLFAKDWIRYCLTGVIMTDPGDASAAGLLNLTNGGIAHNAFSLADLPELSSFIPDIAESCHMVSGHVTSQAANETSLLAGIPVVSGTIDLAMGAFGDGLTDDHVLHITAGTWSINQMRSGNAFHPRYLLQTIQSPWPNETLLVESSPTSAINIAWLQKLLSKTNADFSQWEQWLNDTSEDTPLYLPYPVGAWDLPSQRAALEDLSVTAGPQQLVQSVYEGIALGHSRQVAKYKKLDAPPEMLLLTGGLSKSKTWSQLLCDFTQLPVEISGDPIAGLRGAAKCAAQGIGMGDFDYNEDRLRLYPRADRSRYCQKRFDAFMDKLNQLN